MTTTPPTITPITKMDRAGCDRLAKVLAALGARYGVQITAAGGTLKNDAEATLKFRVRVLDVTAATVAEKKDFERLCGLFGLSHAHYKATFRYKGEIWELIGFYPGRPKYCMRTRRKRDGKELLFGEDIKRELKLVAPPVVPPAATTTPKIVPTSSRPSAFAA